MRFLSPKTVFSVKHFQHVNVYQTWDWYQFLIGWQRYRNPFRHVEVLELHLSCWTVYFETTPLWLFQYQVKQKALAQLMKGGGYASVGPRHRIN